MYYIHNYSYCHAGLIVIIVVDKTPHKSVISEELNLSQCQQGCHNGDEAE